MVDIGTGLVGVAAAISMAAGALISGWAEAKVGIAALGIIAERDDMFGKALIFTVIPETAMIFGLVVAILILGLAG